MGNVMRRWSMTSVVQPVRRCVTSCVMAEHRKCHRNISRATSSGSKCHVGCDITRYRVTASVVKCHVRRRSSPSKCHHVSPCQGSCEMTHVVSAPCLRAPSFLTLHMRKHVVSCSFWAQTVHAGVWIHNLSQQKKKKKKIQMFVPSAKGRSLDWQLVPGHFLLSFVHSARPEAHSDPPPPSPFRLQTKKCTKIFLKIGRRFSFVAVTTNQINLRRSCRLLCAFAFPSLPMVLCHSSDSQRGCVALRWEESGGTQTTSPPVLLQLFPRPPVRHSEKAQLWQTVLSRNHNRLKRSIQKLKEKKAWLQMSGFFCFFLIRSEFSDFYMTKVLFYSWIKS